MDLLGAHIHGRERGVWSVNTNVQECAAGYLACGVTGWSVSRHGNNTRCLYHCGEFWEEEEEE